MFCSPNLILVLVFIFISYKFKIGINRIIIIHVLQNKI